MADIKPTAAAAPKASTSVQPKKSGNLISLIAPFTCIVLGYLIWRFVLGAPSNFMKPDQDASHWFWPDHANPKGALVKMYEGGILVPLLIGAFFKGIFKINQYPDLAIFFFNFQTLFVILISSIISYLLLSKVSRIVKKDKLWKFSWYMLIPIILSFGI